MAERELELLCEGGWNVAQFAPASGRDKHGVNPALGVTVIPGRIGVGDNDGEGTDIGGIFPNQRGYPVCRPSIARISSKVAQRWTQMCVLGLLEKLRAALFWPQPQ